MDDILRYHMKQREPNGSGRSSTDREWVVDQLNRGRLIYDSHPEDALQLCLGLLDSMDHPDLVFERVTALVICGESAYRLGDEEYRQYYHEAETLWPRIESPSNRAKLLNELARIRRRHGDYSEALGFLIEARSILEGLDEPGGLAHTFDIIGNLLKEVGEYEQSLRYLLRGYEIRVDHDLYEGQLNSLINIGSVYGELKDYPKALEYCEKALEMSREGDHQEGLAMALDHIGAAYVASGDDEKGLEYLLQSLAIASPERFEICYTLNAIGTAYEHLEQYEYALEYQQRALAVAEKGKNARMRAFILGNIGGVHGRRGEYDTAIYMFLQALRICRDAGLRVEEFELHERLAGVYRDTGAIPEALDHYKSHAQLREELFSAERMRAVAATELRYALLNTERERELLRLRAEKAEQDAEYRARELNTIALQLTQRNEVLKALHDVALPYSRDSRGQTKELAEKIIGNIQAVGGAQDGWALFDEQFEQVYREFIGKLRELGPKLTPTEIKISVLIKMNLSTKQIADLLFTSLLTVKTHRTHIRRKLGMDGQENLGSFLLSL